MAPRYKIAGPDIVHENFGGDLVVLNLASGQYFGLNNAGATLWTAILDGVDSTEITGEGAVVAGAAQFVSQLIDHGLIVQDAAAGVAARLSAPVLNEVPTIDVYDDLADLIVADPIHDVDSEMGWPKRPDVI